MGSIYRFKDKDGKEKWGEISRAYDPNADNPKDIDGLDKIPVVIDNGYDGARELRWISLSEILESR